MRGVCVTFGAQPPSDREFLVAHAKAVGDDHTVVDVQMAPTARCVRDRKSGPIDYGNQRRGYHAGYRHAVVDQAERTRIDVACVAIQRLMSGLGEFGTLNIVAAPAVHGADSGCGSHHAYKQHHA
jgi:hypothetical protein